jgi:hypothetical protein
MGQRRVPHYVKFARTIALVSVTLPLSSIAILEACSSSSSTTEGPLTGVQGGGVRAADSGPGMGSFTDGGGGGVLAADSGPEMEASSITTGTMVMPDSGTDDASDEGGGPHRGTPELPANFFA